VHPALAALRLPKSALVLGGGDGLAVRELLRYRSLERITLVDLDREVTALFSSHPQLKVLNGGSLNDPRVHVVSEDAWQWLESNRGRFDAIIIDLPDPGTYAVAKLYTAPFYRLVARALAPEGLVALQATSPLFARDAYWCIVATVEAAGLRARPYHALVPSFGDWGFVLAGHALPSAPLPAARALPPGLRFLDAQTLASLFVFGPDIGRVPVEANRLDTQKLVQLYDRGWSAAARDLPRGWD